MNDISNEQLSAYLDDALSPDDRAAVEKALANSPVLRGELAALKQTQAWVRALPSPTVPTGFEQRVLRVLQRPRARTNWWVIAPSAFGAVATAVLMVLVIHQESPPKKKPPPRRRPLPRRPWGLPIPRTSVLKKPPSASSKRRPNARWNLLGRNPRFSKTGWARAGRTSRPSESLPRPSSTPRQGAWPKRRTMGHSPRPKGCVKRRDPEGGAREHKGIRRPRARGIHER
jgi:hypothetical protein